jgi:hypothetical protein
MSFVCREEALRRKESIVTKRDAMEERIAERVFAKLQESKEEQI